jgi:hypothetical protein
MRSCKRAAELADKFGPGFAVTSQVRDAIRAHQTELLTALCF